MPTELAETAEQPEGDPAPATTLIWRAHAEKRARCRQGLAYLESLSPRPRARRVGEMTYENGDQKVVFKLVLSQHNFNSVAASAAFELQMRAQNIQATQFMTVRGLDVSRIF